MIHWVGTRANPAMNQLTDDQSRHLRTLAQHLKPVVMLGSRGLTDAVQAEIERALNDHELVKVKLNAGDREQRSRDVEAICNDSGAALVQRIGNTLSIYRRHPEKPRIALPGDVAGKARRGRRERS